MKGISLARRMSKKARAAEVLERLSSKYPGTARELCELNFEDPFQLLSATILSAQCTDKMVNATTPALFAKYPTPFDLASADISELEQIIHSTGFYRNKAKNLVAMAQALVELGGEVPTEMDELVKLGGVGRKTANVVRSVAFGLPGLPVDTHVKRITTLLGLTTKNDPVAIEVELNAIVPEKSRGAFSLQVILHGRSTCVARRPKCSECILSDICPSAKKGLEP